jgi:hypothetical protein
MTVRTAELVMAIATMLISIAIMWKSTELSIGWVPQKGPGSGAWPFWLSTGMYAGAMVPQGDAGVALGRDIYLAYRVLRGRGFGWGYPVPADRDQLYRHLFRPVAFPVFLFAIRRSSQLDDNLVIFCMFEWALTIPLPKAISEPLFYPIYDLIY